MHCERVQKNTETGMRIMAVKKEKSFEDNIGRLEEIVSMLERGDAQLKDSLALFEEGTKLVGVCSEMLENARQQVVKLQKGADGTPDELPFDEEG